MPTLTFIAVDGREHVVDATSGTTLMHAAVESFVPGIIGDCGGCCSCATCHVYVDEQWLAKLAPRSDNEAQMLEGVLQPRGNSRLGCQITINDELDGMIVEIPDAQC